MTSVGWFIVWVGERGWWFSLWFAEHWKGVPAAWPAAEQNQGLLSLITLVAALWIARIEQRRANVAEEKAASAARAAELNEIERAHRAEEHEIQLTREAEAQRRREQIDQEIGKMSEFVSAAKALIRDAEMALEDDRDATLKMVAETNVSSVFLVQASTAARARAAAEGLNAIAPASPLDPKLILATREAIIALSSLATANPNMSREGVGKWFSDRIDALITARGKITEQQIALVSRLAPVTQPPLDEPTFGAGTQF